MQLTIPSNIINKIKHCTAINDHNGALFLLASTLKLQKYCKIMLGILEIHDAEGYMPENLYNYRHEISEEVMKCAEQMLTADSLAQVKAAF